MTQKQRGAEFQRVLAMLVLLLVAAHAFPCTTFCLQGAGAVLFGKNYDFGIGGGMLVVNKRGVAKVARAAALDQPARWTSRHGSLTFNQYGREFPSGGINESGLVVELMWLDEARYPSADRRPAVGVLEWIQYQLDNFASVEEVIASAGKVRIASSTPLHYLVADSTGRCASIEFLDGKLVMHSGAALPVRVLTNDTYARSLAFLGGYRGFGGERPIPEGQGSLERFARAASLVRRYETEPRGPQVDEAFRVLESAASPGYTQWSIVYDVRNLRVHFRTLDVPVRRSVDLSALEFSCSTPVGILDLAARHEGDVSARFSEYTRDRNHRLIVRSFGGVDFLRNVPPDELERLARHPDTMACDRAFSKTGR